MVWRRLPAALQNMFRATCYTLLLMGLPIGVSSLANKAPPVQQRRRHFLASFLSGAVLPTIAKAAETVGKDENCNDATCLGVWDGLLADCPHTRNFGGAACVSSQDDTPGVFAEPWDYSESTTADWQQQMTRLKEALNRVAELRGDEVRLVISDGRYLRVAFSDAKSGERSVGEW